MMQQKMKEEEAMEPKLTTEEKEEDVVQELIREEEQVKTKVKTQALKEMDFWLERKQIKMNNDL